MTDNLRRGHIINQNSNLLKRKNERRLEQEKTGYEQEKNEWEAIVFNKLIFTLIKTPFIKRLFFLLSG